MRNGVALAGIAALFTGCFTQDFYVVPTAQLTAPPLPTAVVAAQRRGDGRSVWLPASALDPSSATAAPSSGTAAADGTATRLVRARAFSSAVTAGATLTWVGTAVSLVGSGLFLAGRIQGDNGLFLSGAFTALAAEPVMWAGIAYWFAGTLRPAQEVPAQSPLP